MVGLTMGVPSQRLLEGQLEDIEELVDAGLDLAQPTFDCHSGETDRSENEKILILSPECGACAGFKAKIIFQIKPRKIKKKIMVCISLEVSRRKLRPENVTSQMSHT